MLPTVKYSLLHIVFKKNFISVKTDIYKNSVIFFSLFACTSVRLSVCLFFMSLVSNSSFLSVFLSLFLLSICLTILCVCIFVCMPVFRFVCLPVCQTVGQPTIAFFVCITVFLSVCMPFCPSESVYPSLSACLFIRLTACKSVFQ